MSGLLDVDRDPAIVFTSNVPGLVAARELIGPDHERVLYLKEEEFADAPADLADPAYHWCIHFWSYFGEVKPSLEAEARIKYPIPTGSIYWQHIEGTMWGINAGRGGDHLWCWNGHEPELLEEAISTWVS